MNENTIDMLIATTQKRITYLYFTLFALVLIALVSTIYVQVMIPGIDVPDGLLTLLTSLLGVLTALITMQSQFWFARSRGGGVPDPAPTAEVKPTE